jgi:hypothetical protein
VSATVASGAAGGNRLRGAAWLTFALLVVVTLASAFLRLAEPAGVSGLAIDIARGAHRVSASVALVVAIGLAIFGWERFRPLGASRGVAAALVALGVALSFLGRFTPSTHPFVALGNPLGGLAMVALAWWLYLAAAPLLPEEGWRALARRGGVGGLLICAAFAAVTAIVTWPTNLLAGLVVQIIATVALAAGVGMLYRSTSQ